MSGIAKRILAGIVAVVLVLGLARLRFDADIFNLLPADLPSVHGLRLHQQNFSNARELIVTLESSDSDATEAAARKVSARLLAEPGLVRSARWQPPWLENLGDGAENLAWLWLQQPPDEVNRFIERLALTNLAQELNATRELLATSLDPQVLARRSYDPLGLSQIPGESALTGFDTGVGLFSNADATFRTVFVEPVDGRMNYRAAAAWVASVRRVVEAAVAESGPGAKQVRTGISGGPAFLAEISTGMESDLQSSVASTIAVIAVLFWLAHRSWRPLGWLILSLGLTLLITMALGGLIFGTLNVVSLGFAAVLLGLAVDYGLVSYQEFAAAPGQSVREVRHEVAPGIAYSAATTACTFLLLGFAGLPGLAQLGVLTAVGLLVGAAVMMFVFLPLVARVPVRVAAVPEASPSPRQIGWVPTGLVLLFCAVVLGARGLPVVTSSTDPLRPRQSPAYDTMDRFKQALGRTNDPIWILASGDTLSLVGDRLAASERALATAKSNGLITSFTLPAGFWPRPDRSGTNQAAIAALGRRESELKTAVLDAGFSTQSLALTEGVLKAWNRGAGDATHPWPENETARWLSSQFSARTPSGQWLALGMVQTDSTVLPRLDLPEGVTSTSWSSLGSSLLAHVSRRILAVTALIAAMLVACLWVAFRNVREVLLSLAALALSFTLLLAVMALIGWQWNLLSLVALPLLLGSSVDSTIHVQLAMRRHGSDLRSLWRITGRALLLCAGANIAGFGSLAWSNNQGLASLDLVCAVGVGCVFVVCVGLLPTWRRWVVAENPPPSPTGKSGPQPSRIYGALAWRVCVAVVRWMPRWMLESLTRIGVRGYQHLKSDRFEIVVRNLLPLVDGNVQEARHLAVENFVQFGRKLADLWRYESGVPDAAVARPGEGWQHFEAALSSGRGVLLVTPHLGNWELGAPLLAERGVRPLVLTAPEPEGQLTRIRSEIRSRMGVDTLVVGENPFAFVEVIRRLQDGGIVALLVDRPPEATRVDVDFLGRHLPATIAAAELARASGCVVLPVCIVRESDGYRAHTLAPIPYDRAQLGTREARIAFTQRMLRVFEPVLRQYPTQWFHFVPVWSHDERS